MNSQVQEAPSVLDIVKQVAAAVVVVAGIAAFYYFADSVGLLYRVLGLVVLVIVAFGIVLTTAAGAEFWAFILDARQEVRRVVWPTKDETVRTTVLVMAMVFIVGLLLWLMDMFLFWGVRLLTGQGG